MARPALTAVEWLLAAGLALLTFLVFARAVGHDFVNYDDPDYVTANPRVLAGVSAETMRWAVGAAEALQKAARVAKFKAKKLTKLDLIAPGECFGEMAYIRGEGERHASVESMTEVMYAEFPSEALDRMSDSCQLYFMRALVSTLAERLELANSRLSQNKN